EALAGACLTGEHVQPGPELEAQALDQGEVGDGQLEQASCGLPGRSIDRHDGSSSTLCRNRSQNGCDPAGSTSRMGRSSARTLTKAPGDDAQDFSALSAAE